MRIAVDDPGRGGEAGDPTYLDVAGFGAEAEACSRRLAKGEQVAVIGRLVLREWTGCDGRRHSAHSVRGSVDFLGSRGDRGEREPLEEGTALPV